MSLFFEQSLDFNSNMPKTLTSFTILPVMVVFMAGFPRLHCPNVTLELLRYLSDN